MHVINTGALLAILAAAPCLAQSTDPTQQRADELIVVAGRRDPLHLDDRSDARATLTVRAGNRTDAWYGESFGHPASYAYVGAPRSVEIALEAHV